MALSLMEGNEAIAWGAVASGCRFYAGYPITPATTIFTWPRFVDHEVAVLERLAIHGFDGCFAFRLLRHLNERKPSGAPCELVRDDADRCYFAVLAEDITQLLLGGLVGQVANINPHYRIPPTPIS